MGRLARGITAMSLAMGCAPPAAPIAHSGKCTYVSAPRPEPDAKYHYRLAAAARGEELCVEVDLPKGPSTPHRWAPEGPLVPFVRDVALAHGDRSALVAMSDGTWVVPACSANRGCRLRYRLLLAEAARHLDNFELAQDHRGTLLAPPSSWLLRPLATRASFRVDVSVPEGTDFITGLARVPDGNSAYVGDIGDLDDTPYAAFGAQRRKSLTPPSGALEIAFTPGDLAPGSGAAIEDWIARAAGAMSAYYGRFPVPHAAIIVKLDEGRGPGEGHAMGNGGAAILVSVGERSTALDLADDWILVHEMVHLAFPDVRRPWAEEGLATYLEPIIRARAGMLAPDEVWRGLIEGLPRGQPAVDDQGLDHTDTWGRRYWGGAMFWLVADLDIRKQTEGRKSLDDAMRAIVTMGGNISARWDLDRALAVGDEAVGVPVLRRLREKLGHAPAPIDLDSMWKSLGVSIQKGRVTYDEAAPLAAIRRDIVARP